MPEYDPISDRTYYSGIDMMITLTLGLVLGSAGGAGAGYYIGRNIERRLNPPAVQQTETHSQSFTQSELPDKLNNEPLRLR